ncbi:MAG: hypothetical protein J6Z15_03280, partial [Oscillospiraceae bacterium]|nr:hypothetical protein [Oscillospiraceae bacterium]
LGDAIGGFLSGAGMGGVKEAAAGIRAGAQNLAQDFQTGRAINDALRQEQAAPVQEQTPRVPAPQAPALTISTQETQNARRTDPLGYALEKIGNGETLTGGDARAILENPQAVQSLRDAGVLTEAVKSGNEGRKQINAAVAALAEQNRAVTTDLQQETERNPQPRVQNQQETAQERTAPPMPEQRQAETPVPQIPAEGRLRVREQTETPLLPSRLTVRAENGTLRENRQEDINGQETETSASAGEEDFKSRAAATAEGARRSYLDRIERSSGVGRLLADLRTTQAVRGARNRASEVSRIRNATEAGNQREVSAQDYGIANGTDEKSARELGSATASRILGRDWDRAVAELSQRGVTLKAMTGQLQKADGNQVRAFFSGDGKTIVVQVDHPTLSWNQLLDHEELHRRIQEDTEYRKAVEDALLSDKKLRAYLPEIIDRYAQAYSRADSTLSSDAVIEEMLADYRAGFDMLDPLGIQTPEYGRAAKRAARDIRAVEKGRESKVGVNVDTGSESANPDSYSIETWNASDYVLNRTAAASDLARQLNVSDQQAMKYIDDVNSIAKIIANDRTRLDYTPSPGRSSFIGNTEYGGSIDFSTICKKRRLYTGTIESIQKALPNTAITADELLAIRNMMKERGYEVSCGLCYVEGSRVKLGEYTQQFLNELKGTGMYVPTMAEMNTSDGQEQLRAEHPEVYDAYVKFMNKLAQRKPKLFQMATEYQGEILKKFKNDGTVDQKNRNGGLRLQSFSDFEIIHLIDTMQVITDMGRVGLAGQAYTKVPDFAWALGNTGLKINLSLIAKGVDENGRIILDEVEGMKRSDAEELRNAYSKNVGTILVTFNDEQLKAAMADPFVDFIIPFHRSQWSKSQYETIGLPANAKDYTDQQNEAYIDKVYNANGKPQRPSNYMPNNYWDFSKTGKENAETYLRMCAENNRRPKFYKLLVDNGDGSYSLQKDGSTDGYWKLLSDYKMYDNEGKGSPQVPVQPKFNMEQAERMLNEYTGGHQRFPVAQDVVDDFLKGKQGKASTEIGDEFQRIFTGEVRTAKGVKLERKEYSAVSHALKTGYGQFDNDGLGGTVNTEDFCYYFDTFSDGSVVISKRIRHERLNIHQERLEEKHGSESRDNRSTGGVDVQRRNGQENGTQRVGDDGRGGEYAVSDSLDRKEQTDIGRDSEEGEGNPAQRSSLIEKASTEISEEDLDEAVYEKMSASMRDIMRRLQEDIDRAKEPEQKPEPKKKVQRASDEEYMAAMDNGRIADAQRLVRETADASMPDSKVRSASTGELRYVYHYTNKNFFEFKRKGASPGSSRTHGDGYYVSPSETAYSSFGRNKMTLFANITAPFEMELTEAQAQAVYDKYFRPLHPNDLGGTYESHVMSKLQTASRVFDYLKEAAEKNNTTTSAILSELGFDGVHDGSIWVAFDSEQLKSADVATYTDDGQIIPLSERFNPEKKDTRYSIEIDPDVAAQFSPEAIALRQSNRTKGAKGERKVSRVRSNTYEYSGLFNEVEAQMDEADEENYTYDPVSEKKSMNEALGRLKADFDGEVSRLSEADKQWGGSDLDTAMGILHRYRTEGRATGNYTDFWNWSKTIQEKGTKGGQFIQAFAKYTRTGTGAAMKGAKDIHDRFKLNPAQQKQVDAAKKKL